MKYIIFIIIIFLFANSTKSQDLVFQNENIIKKRISPSNKNVNKITSHVLNNNISFYDLWKPIPYENEIDWNVNPYKSRSWYLYFQSLRMVGYLSAGFENTNDVKSIKKAMQIINQWHKYYEQDFKKSVHDQLNKNVWGDHAVANRVLNLSHLIAVSKEHLSAQELDLLFNILHFHGQWLNNDRNYTHGNHAIMIDRALMQLSLTINFKESPDWFKKSNNRMKIQFNHDITSEGISIENSAFYHNYVLKLLIDLENVYKKMNMEIPNWLLKKEEGMKKFLNYLLKPNGKYVLFGDTYYRNNRIDLLKIYKDSIFSRDQINQLPLSAVFPISGYAFFRNSWDTTSSHIAFTNTNLTNVHKHNDNLSFTYFNNGEDLIIDAGHTGYDNKQFRNHFLSTVSHSTITADGLNIDNNKLKKNEVTIDDYYIDENYKYVSGKVNYTSKDLLLKRTILIMGDSIIYIHDSISHGRDFKHANQLFNLGRNYTEYEFIEHKNYSVFNSKFERNNLSFYQLEFSNGKLNLFKCDSIQLRGCFSNGHNKLFFGNQIEFNKPFYDKSAEYHTIISTCEKELNYKQLINYMNFYQNKVLKD